MSDNIVEVAVGVLIREDGRMLLSSRPEGKPYAGYWEFPGGKLERVKPFIRRSRANSMKNSVWRFLTRRRGL